MKRLQELIGRLKGLEVDLTETIKDTLIDNEDLIIEYNAEDQLYEKGITREGTSIADYAPYSAYTIQIKQEKGQPFNRVTLRDEGDFHLSFYLEITETGFEIKAADWKTEELTFSYGDGIIGLTDENLRDLTQSYILPALLKRVNKTVYNHD